MFTNDLLKKGVPTNLEFPVFISIKDIINICKKTENIKEEIDVAKLEFYNNCCKIFGEDVADFFDLKQLSLLEISIDPDTLDRYFVISIYNFIFKIMNVTTDDIFKTTENFDKIIAKLTSISEENFSSNFPLLYKKYLRSKVECNSLVGMKKNFSYMNEPTKIPRIKLISELYDCSFNTAKNKIDNASTSYNYRNFLDEFIKMMNKVYSKYNNEEFCEVKTNIEVNDDDIEKLNIYITYVLQERLKQVPNEYKQKFFYYISEYYFENNDLIMKNKKIFSLKYDKIIKLQDMYEDYKKIMISNPNLKINNFNYSDFSGMKLDDVNEFMEEYFSELSASWDFFDKTNFDDETINKIKEYYKNNNIENDEELKKELYLFIEKKEFFDKTDPYYRIKGKNNFDGYIGYIYNNGCVILEKFFENAKIGKVAKNQAIYIMSIIDFQKLTVLSKSKIISEKLCKRFIHKGDWQKKVKYEIENSEYICPVNEVNRLLSSTTVEKVNK